jgi:hypothetical protein
MTAANVPHSLDAWDRCICETSAMPWKVGLQDHAGSLFSQPGHRNMSLNFVFVRFLLTALTDHISTDQSLRPVNCARLAVDEK